MAKVIAIANQKGGVGKTSTANAFAAGLKRKGYHVLAIDMDPQGNLSSSVDAEITDESYTILEVMKEGIDGRKAIQHLPPFDIIPADLSLAVYEQELISLAFGRDVRLRESIEPLRPLYDYIIIDTAPSLTMLTINALVAADEVIIPATASFFATSGLEQLYNTITNIRRYCGNPGLKIDGILFTKYEGRTINGQAIKGEAEKYTAAIGTKVFKTCIRKAIAMDESQTFRKDIFTYSHNSNPALDYMAFVEEYLSDQEDQ